MHIVYGYALGCLMGGIVGVIFFTLEQQWVYVVICLVLVILGVATIREINHIRR